MATLAYSRSIYSYFKKSYHISNLTQKIFSSTNYHGNTAYYKAILGQYVNFGSYIDIYKGTINTRSIQTDINIQPGILGAEARSVISIHGKPDIIFKEKELSIYVYKWKFNGLKTKCEIHLYNDKAFLINYVYNQLDEADQDYILKSIARKYLPEYTHEADLLNCKISDKNNNVLFVDNVLAGLKISYLSNCESDWYESMTAYVNDKAAEKATRVSNSERKFFNKI